MSFITYNNGSESPRGEFFPARAAPGGDYPQPVRLNLSKELRADLAAAKVQAGTLIPVMGHDLSEAGRTAHLGKIVDHAEKLREYADTLAALAGQIMVRAEAERIAIIERNPDRMPHPILRAPLERADRRVG